MTLTSTVEKPSWRWRWTLVSAKRLNSLWSPLGEAVDAGLGGAFCFLVVLEQQWIGGEVALAHPVALELLLDLLAELVDPDLVDQDLDPRAGAIDPEPLLAVEDPHAGLGDLQVVTVVELHELIQRRRQAGHDRGAAADPDLDALDAVVVDPRDERHVMNASDRVVLIGRRKRGLHLPRHRLGDRMADEIADVGAGVRGDVEQLALERARSRVARHVAHRVAAALPAAQAGVSEVADQLGRLREWDVVHLDVLPRGDVALLQRDVLLDPRRERIKLIWCDAAERKLDPDHLHIRLALSVDALLEAELDELIALELAPQIAGRLGVEVVELTLEDRDDVPRDVLEHLRVLERALFGGTMVLGLRAHPAGRALASGLLVDLGRRGVE